MLPRRIRSNQDVQVQNAERHAVRDWPVSHSPTTTASQVLCHTLKYLLELQLRREETVRLQDSLETLKHMLVPHASRTCPRPAREHYQVSLKLTNRGAASLAAQQLESPRFS